jgi:hypothetical protein
MLRYDNPRATHTYQAVPATPPDCFDQHVEVMHPQQSQPQLTPAFR